MGAPAAHPPRAALPGSLSRVSALPGCGRQVGKGRPQEPAGPGGDFPVRVTSAKFPHAQNLAKDSSMQIVVENAGAKRVPNINVTVKCGRGLGGSFMTATDESDVADPERPQFVVNKIPTRTERGNPPLDPAPLERSSAFVDTYPLGPLEPGRTATFSWDVTAVKAGPYRLCWRVNAGLYGKARAVATGDSEFPVRGEFKGEVSNKPPKARIGDDGKTVIESNR